MTYRVWEPTPPVGSLQHLSDQERKIADGFGIQRAVWDLNAIQLSLAREPTLTIVYSTSAQESMSDSLKWDDADMRKFIGQLTKGRYEGSQWCYAPKRNTPHAADVYCMGFNRFQGIENQQLTPWAYVKFSMVGPNLDRLYVLSAHPEGQY